MKRDVKIIPIGGGSPPYTATIIIDKNGMMVENKKPEYKSDNDFIQSFIRGCIDMDTWQHSWHLNVEKAKLKGAPERKEIRKILNGKIESRKQEIQALKDARNILGRW